MRGPLRRHSAFVANGLSFLPVIAALVVIRPQRSVERSPHTTTLDSLGQGIAYIRSRSDLRILLGLSATVVGLAFPNVAVQIPFFVKEVLKLDASALGKLMAIGGAAGFAGAMALMAVPPEKRVRRLGLTLGGVSLGLPLLALSPRAMPVVPALPLLGPGIVVFVLALAMSSTLGLLSVMIQHATPDELRGRVSSVHGLVFLGVLPFSSLITTHVTDRISMPGELTVAGVLTGLLSLVLVPRLARAAHRSASATPC